MTDNKELYEDLKLYQRTSPVLWAVLRGASTMGSICRATLWLPQDVKPELQSHLSDGLIVEVSEGRYEPGEDYRELSRFQNKLWIKLAALDRGQGRPATQGLTQKQSQLLGLLSTNFGTEPFKTLDAAKAQGYEKAGFTKNQLQSLVNKGKLKFIEGRPMRWAVIDTSSE